MKRILSQRQEIMIRSYDDNGFYEKCICPFCEHELEAEWDNGWLGSRKPTCCHFTGYVQGHGTPTAMFKGVLA